MEWTEEKLLAVRDQNESWLMQRPGVAGTAIGHDEKGRLCLKILTDHMDAAERTAIRSRLKDVPVSFEETGTIEAL